jgi:HPt (histidine-containing phosphotransfer) domain-containing protein
MPPESPDDQPQQTNQAALRQWIDGLAEEYGVDVDDLLIQSRRRDPMYKGTDADHAKAEWFANLWEDAVEERESDRIHVRGVHYHVYMSDADVEPPTDCSWDVYENLQKCYDYLEECAVLARILGYIPLDGIIDKRADTRTITTYGRHSVRPDPEDLPSPTGVTTPRIPDPDDRAELRFDVDETTFSEWAAERVAANARDRLSFDKARQSPYHIELWSEKTLPDYIRGDDGLAARHGCNVVVEGEGDLSLTVAHELAQRIEDAGKPAVILYLADWDPKGMAMPSNMSGKIAWLNQRGDLNHRVVVDRLAVTAKQIEALDLPRKPIEESTATGTGGVAYNRRITEWEKAHGAGATELNALEQYPDEFRRIVREALEQYSDPDIPTKNREAADDWEDDIQARVEKALREEDVDEDLADLQQWIADFNEAYAAVADVFDHLRSLKGDGSELGEWESFVEEIVGGVKYPVASVPDGDAALPEDPIYDSDRSYAENKMRIDRYRRGES